MADLLDSGLSWLRGKRHAQMTREIVYQRGAIRIEINATVGRTPFEQEDSQGRVIQIEARDYLIRSEDLVIAGKQVEPARGDKVHDTIGTKVHTFEVLPSGTVPAFSYSDAYRRTIRVHTKHVGSVDA